MKMTVNEKGKSTNSKSVLVLTLPSRLNVETLTFKEQFYIAEYPESGEGISVHFDNDIKFVNLPDFTKATITVSGKLNNLKNLKSCKDIHVVISSFSDYDKYFDVILDPKQKKWVLKIKKRLDNVIIRDKNELVLLLEAKSNGFKKGSATLVVQIKKEIAMGPKFKQAYYEAKYPKSGTGNIDLSEIVIENVVDASKIGITIDSKSLY